MKIFPKCKKCGYIPEPDEKDSNENWNVYNTTCPKCGGFVGLEVEEDEDN